MIKNWANIIITFMIITLLPIKTFGRPNQIKPCIKCVMGCSLSGDQIEIGLFTLDKQNIQQPLFSTSYAQKDIETLPQFIAKVLTEAKLLHNICVEIGAIAVAGETAQNRDYIKSPHFPEPIDGKKIAAAANLKKVFVINNFEMLCYGINATKNTEQIIEIQKGKKQSLSPILVIGTGTGVGAAQMIPKNNGLDHDVFPIGASFTHFIALNNEELEYANYIKKINNTKYDIAQGSALGSKGSILAMYNFFKNPETTSPYDTDNQLQIFKARFHDPIAHKAVQFYMKLYTRLIRNLMNTLLPYGGVYITNSVANDNPELFDNSNFIKNLSDDQYPVIKNTLERMPIYLLSDKKLRLYGAAYYAINAHEEFHANSIQKQYTKKKK